MSKQSNFLNGKDKYQLNRWLESHKELADNYTDSQIADRATAELQFAVTSGNIIGARKVLGLRKRGKDRTNDVGILAKEVMALHIQLGTQASPELQRILSQNANHEASDIHDYTQL